MSKPHAVELLADIDMGRAHSSDRFVLDGWGVGEGGHRWSIGPQSRLRLPGRLGPDCILVIDAAPWVDAASLPAQTIMVAVNDRLLSTTRLVDRRVMAWPVPASAAGEAAVLTLTHLHGRLSRAQAGVYRDGQPLGLSVSTVRLFRLLAPPSQHSWPALAGSLADGVMARESAAHTGLEPADLVTRFESIGHDCEFGTVQRHFGAEPLGLLRFAGLVTHKLVDGLMARFDGVGAPSTTTVFVAETPVREWKVHEQRYYLWYSAGKRPEEATYEAMLREQCRRLVFLRRKFLDDLRLGEKVFVLTRGEVLTEPEALAVFCALQLEGPNTLLWTVHGDASRTGEVDRLLPGFLRGHLGPVDDRNYATPDAWLSVLTTAYLVGCAAARKEEKPFFSEEKKQKTFDT